VISTAAALLAATAPACGAPLALSHPHPHGGVALFPKIAAPANAAERSINVTLARLDAEELAKIDDCRSMAKDEEPQGVVALSRKIKVTMAGPRYLSFFVTDFEMCGGAHGDSSHSAEVYDLATGKAADWDRLLPQALNDRLFALYMAGYAAAGGTEDCRKVLSQDTVGATIWPDPAAGGLAVVYDSPIYAAFACGIPVVLPLAKLKAAHVSADLTDAIAQARPSR
jgi:hypothetical protein